MDGQEIPRPERTAARRLLIRMNGPAATRVPGTGKAGLRRDGKPYPGIRSLASVSRSNALHFPSTSMARCRSLKSIAAENACA